MGFRSRVRTLLQKLACSEESGCRSVERRPPTPYPHGRTSVHGRPATPCPRRWKSVDGKPVTPYPRESAFLDDTEGNAERERNRPASVRTLARANSKLERRRPFSYLPGEDILLTTTRQRRDPSELNTVSENFISSRDILELSPVEPCPQVLVPGPAHGFFYNGREGNLETLMRDRRAWDIAQEGRKSSITPMYVTSPGVTSPQFFPSHLVRRSPSNSSRSSTASLRRRENSKPLRPSQDPMSPSELLAVLNRFDSAAGNVRYVVCETAAMVVWGNTDILPCEVKVLCPRHSFETLRMWAASNGMQLYSDDLNTIGVTCSGGRIRAVKLNILPSDSAFRQLECVIPKDLNHKYAGTYGTSLKTSAKVLSLSSLLDKAAERYVQAEHGSELRRVIGAEAIWLLKRLNDMSILGNNESVDPAAVPHVVAPAFWWDFVMWCDSEGQNDGLQLLKDVNLTASKVSSTPTSIGGRGTSPMYDQDENEISDSVPIFLDLDDASTSSPVQIAQRAEDGILDPAATEVGCIYLATMRWAEDRSSQRGDSITSSMRYGRDSPTLPRNGV